MAGLKNISVAGGTPGFVYLMAGQQSGAAGHHATPGAPVRRDCARALHFGPEVGDGRAERIRLLREQIRSGTYNPDPYLIARRLFERGF